MSKKGSKYTDLDDLAELLFRVSKRSLEYRAGNTASLLLCSSEEDKLCKKSEEGKTSAQEWKGNNRISHLALQMNSLLLSIYSEISDPRAVQVM